MLIHPTSDKIVAFSTTRDCLSETEVNVPVLLPSHQIHGTKTQIIDREFMEKTQLEQILMLHGVDALATDLKNVCIGVKTADCIPVLIYEERMGVIAAVHAGWKGTVQRIVEKNIDILKEYYGIKPENLKAVIGPGISLESFEVGSEVYDEFKKAGFPMEQIARMYAKWHIDLWEANRLQLVGKGLKKENIHIAGVDTLTNENFYSARRMKVCDGRIINGIFLRN
ncbi:MAG: peptidoglycan editing factor PgeF [Bacteroidaceae bacterium]|nr:peptidoglycan editing factor PgeF [Bacteroidaceae bacterium]